ncbi:hypothetical protein ABE83_03210 [Streptomyces sp. CFMR 7]|nr:hypothetical protein ABE83_03210 [Streptomyces sp. CFMR 7]
MLARAAKVLLQELVEEQATDLDVAALRAAVEEVAPRAAVMTAAATVVTLVPEERTRPRSPCGPRSPTGTPRCARSSRCWTSPSA